LNPSMLKRGTAASEHAGVSRHVAFVEADLNDWRPDGPYHAAIALQSLHHVLNLEGLLAGVRTSLVNGGRFLICDTIGRNGHMRWPEALRMIGEFWRQLPPSYRFNHQLRRYEEQFENFDCSHVGFEGIRAQDILPLLCQNFQFESFLGYGNLIDPFIDRSFGPNFDASKDWDRQFIDRVHARDEQGLASGELKPTQMIGSLQLAPRPVRVQGAPAEAFIRWPGPADDCLDHPEPSANGHAYAWGSWPHRAEDELKIVTRLLAETQQRLRQLEAAPRVTIAPAPELETEIVDRTLWALGLEHQLNERTEWALQLQAEVKEHQRLQAIWERRSLIHRLKKLRP
jgi:hypothetical protein